MWKFLNESLEGTSHRDSNTPCQDSSFVTPFRFEKDSGLILTCSDGAGSAQKSKIGSELACQLAVAQIMQFLESGRTINEATAEDVLRWTFIVHEAIVARAAELETLPRELACTLLLAAIGEKGSLFAQLGDGGMVILQDAEYRPVFWPKTGEYQNTTYFISDAKFGEHIQIHVRQETVAELAIFSDGLQMLALKYATKTAHQPFFKPLFLALRQSEDQGDLSVPMRQWLDSASINQRTDDDKTLILATRIAADAE